MKNINISNPQFASPKNFAGMSAVISMLSGVLGLVLVMGAIPETPIERSPLGIFCCLVILFSAILIFVPKLMSWDWQSKYFGVPIFHVSMISLLGIIPLLCVVFYGRISWVLSAIILISFVILHYWWMRRFVLVYKRIFCDEGLVRLLYCEIDGGIYYMQKVDKYFIDNIFKFRQFPADRYLIVCVIVSFSMLFYVDAVTSITGLPFAYSFLAMASLPVSLAFMGLATRGWLIFYYYPNKIYRRCGKRVYVDMVNIPIDFKKNIAVWKRSLKSSRLK